MSESDKEPANESAEEQTEVTKQETEAKQKTDGPPQKSGGNAPRMLVGLLIGVGILGGSAYAAWHFWKTRPEARQFKPPRKPLKVEFAELKQVDFPVVIPSQGRVKSRAVSGIVPEVAGRIVRVAPAFREGGFFKQNEALLWLDDRNYRIATKEANATVRQLQVKLRLEQINRASYANAVALAKANLSKAEAALELEKARQSAAIANLRRLNALTQSSPLARNEPQIKEANATVQSATAELTKAQADLEQRPDQMEADLRAQIDAAKARLARTLTDLERTIVRAPSFPGRIADKTADVGQHVTPNTTLARAIAVDYAEVRLPVPSSLVGHLDSPDPIIDAGGNSSQPSGTKTRVDINATIGGREHGWTGEIERTEARVNQSSQQNFVIARVPNPYGRSPALKDGRFVRARIHGRPIKNVFIIPRQAVRRGDFVLMIDEEKRLRRWRLISLWRDEQTVIARQVEGEDGQVRDLKEDEVLCLTNVDFAANGDKVDDGTSPPQKKSPKGP